MLRNDLVSGKEIYVANGADQVEECGHRVCLQVGNTVVLALAVTSEWRGTNGRCRFVNG